ncbi:RNaseH domain-containing protein [Streptomyces sp. NBRC 110028]|uniref:RNaseH domain-containing protein n=1 Tax=Streptomyces sp. NBRC 110028 TaxID=1621260 RepID=UPI0006E2EE2E|nr:RNaseH domain-containing protein [Streptomyces sp. NBRC 110028]
MPSNDTRMSMLAAPLTSTLMGTAWLYRLPEKIEHEWNKLRAIYRGKTGSRANLPYAGLLMVLRASGATSASLSPTSKKNPPEFLALSRRPPTAQLRAAVALWEQALLQTPSDEISLAYSSPLADLFASVEPEQVAIWDHVRFGPHAVDADGWAWDAAGWNLASLVAKTDLRVDGRTVPLRPDTANNVMVWDTEHLWSNNWLDVRTAKDKKNDSLKSTAEEPPEPEEWKIRRHYAALRVEVAMKSLHSLPVPLVVMTPRVSRLSNQINGARTAWWAPRSPSRPLLCVNLGGKGKYTHLEHTSRLALDAWVRLMDEPVFPRAPEDTEFLPVGALDLSGEPGNFRALIPFSKSFPIGKGVGLHTVTALADHLSTVTGQDLVHGTQVAKVLSVAARKTEHGRDATLLDDTDLRGIMAAAGCSKLRVLALYEHQEMRTRMQRLLAYHFNRPDLADGMPEDEVVQLGCHAEVLLHRAPQLLSHGDHHDLRGALADSLPGLEAKDTGVLALVETEYDAKEWGRQRRAARREEDGAVDPYVLDAKPEVSRHLARHGMIAQFLTPETRKRRSKKKEREPASPLEALGMELAADFPGHNAIGDMLRSVGMVHPRLTRTISTGNGLKDRVAHLGLHMRAQLGEKHVNRTEEPKLMWVLTAFVPVGEHWKALAYLPAGRSGSGGWFNYARGQSLSRSRPIPEGSRGDDMLPRRIDHALYELSRHLECGYVLYVSGDSTRPVWPLLANKNADLHPDDNCLAHGRPALPGATLAPEHRPQAVIRTTSSADPSIPLPALFHEIDEDGNVSDGDKTSNALFQLDGTKTTFVMSRRPQQMDGKTPSAKSGRMQGRWACNDKEQQAETWYNLTATEIAVIQHPDSEDALPYALTTARLCNHALAWEHRTRHPLPIHAAIQMDKDHPEYRRTIDWDTDETAG